VVQDTRETLQQIKNVVNKLDQPEPQVLIEARIVYATDSFTRGLGVQWGGGYEKSNQYGGNQYVQGVYGDTAQSIQPAPSPSQSGFAVNLPNQGATTLGIGSYISKLTGSSLFTIDAQLQIGETEGEATTVSKPKIVTLNNEEATIVQGTTIYKEVTGAEGEPGVEEIEASLQLSVTPKITPNDKVLLQIEIKDDDPSVGPTGETATDTRTINTKLIVDDGNTIVIGGVQEAEQSESQESVPAISNLPVFGWLFKNKNISSDKRELLVFIRPKII
jgi:type IV pilus assembly protein PilQ